VRIGRTDDAHVDTEPLLKGYARLEPVEIVGLADQEQIADLPVSGVDPELLLETLEDADRLEREPDLGLGGKLAADAAGRLARGACPDRFALEHEHVLHATPGEMIGDAAAHHAAADDDHAGCPWQFHGGFDSSRRRRSASFKSTWLWWKLHDEDLV